MKQVVEKSKQTVWILTMLTVMVVLSAYYLVSDPLITENMVENQVPSNATEAVGDNLNLNVSTENVLENSNITEQVGMAASDLLIGLKMERDQTRAKQMDQLYTMMNSDITEETIVNIQDKLDKLMILEESELVLEKLIIAEGFNDAVVLTNGNSADVIIQSEELTKADAVNVIKMVSDRLEVPAVNVHIKRVN